MQFFVWTYHLILPKISSFLSWKQEPLARLVQTTFTLNILRINVLLGRWAGQLWLLEVLRDVTPVWCLPLTSFWSGSRGSTCRPWWSRTGPSPRTCTEAGRRNTRLLFSSPAKQRVSSFGGCFNFKSINVLTLETTTPRAHNTCTFRI